MPNPTTRRTGGVAAELTPEAVGDLASADKLRPLGEPNPDAVKFSSAVELIALPANREWLNEATKTIGQVWKQTCPARGHGSDLIKRGK